MKLKNILLYLLPIAGLCSSCNDEWENEQFTHYISFKAPLTVMVYLESMYAIDLVMKRRHFSYQSL